MKLAVGLLLLLGGLLSGCSDHGNSLQDFPARSVTLDGKNYQYRVWLPKNRDPNKKMPVILFLHGSGARGDDNTSQVDTLFWAIKPVKEKFDFIVVAPQCRPNTFWGSQEMADYALATLDQSVKEFDGDPQRLYLVGFSLGGYGVWQIAAGNPGKFAALVPVAGGVVEHPTDRLGRSAIIPSVGAILDSPDPFGAVAKVIGQTPVWAFHGDKDDSIPVQFSRNIVKALQENGSTNVRYTEYVGDGHQILGKAIAEPGLLDWLAAQRLP